jgi:hypothetical protein
MTHGSTAIVRAKRHDYSRTEINHSPGRAYWGYRYLRPKIMRLVGADMIQIACSLSAYDACTSRSLWRWLGALAYM